jgi:hypothetical protein
MIDYTAHKRHDETSISSTESSTLKSVWNRLSHLFHSPEDSNRRLSTSSNESDCSGRSLEIGSNTTRTRHCRVNQRKKKIIAEEYGQVAQQLSATSSSSSTSYATAPHPPQPLQQFVIPPFSPTYCKANEFPYSNFYVKLPNGKWMVRYRSGNRDILGTDEFEGYMI